MTRAGFELSRGENEKNEHIPIEKLKVITNYEVQEFEKQAIHYEKEIETDNIQVLKEDYKRVIRKFNTLAKQYTRIKVINERTLERAEKIENEIPLLSYIYRNYFVKLYNYFFLAKIHYKKFYQLFFHFFYPFCV